MDGLIETLQAHSQWTWIAGGVLLIALEALLPGAVVVWFGVAAILTGLLVAVADPGLNVQVLFFSIVSVASIVAFKFWQRKHPPAVPASDSGQALNQPGSEFIGRTLVLATNLRNGVGRVKAADTSWRCTGPDLDAGTAVKVVGLQSGTLRVEAAGD